MWVGFNQFIENPKSKNSMPRKEEILPQDGNRNPAWVSSLLYKIQTYQPHNYVNQFFNCGDKNDSILNANPIWWLLISPSPGKASWFLLYLLFLV